MEPKKIIRISERGWFFIKWPLGFLIAILFSQTFFLTIFIVDGSSMASTLKDNQVLFVDKISYLSHSPQKNDIVVMQFPGDPSQRIFVKRVVGLPDQKFKAGDQDQWGLVSEKNFTLGAGEYYVLGDNRDQSGDSRLWGPVWRENIIGRVF